MDLMHVRSSGAMRPECPDNIPIGPVGGLVVVSAYGAAALIVALWPIGRRDA